jgi:hypothetical protein
LLPVILTGLRFGERVWMKLCGGKELGELLEGIVRAPRVRVVGELEAAGW